MSAPLTFDEENMIYILQNVIQNFQPRIEDLKRINQNYEDELDDLEKDLEHSRKCMDDNNDLIKTLNPESEGFNRIQEQQLKIEKTYDELMDRLSKLFYALYHNKRVVENLEKDGEYAKNRLQEIIESRVRSCL